MDRYWFGLGGGVGDALLEYIRHPFLSRMQSIKERNPDFTVCIFDQVHNTGIVDMFQYHPAVSRHVHIHQIDQHRGYEAFDRSIVPSDIRYWDQFSGLEDYQPREPFFVLNDDEVRRLSIIAACPRPLTVIQPYAGLRHRDAFNQRSLHGLVSELPGTKVIIGRNHARGGERRVEGFVVDSDPSVVNLIDQVGIRFTWHLIREADAFVGCHSSMVLAAWHLSKPTVCIVPWPHLEDHWNGMDRKYLQGVDRENTLISKFEALGNDTPHFDYESINVAEIRDHIARFANA